MSWHIPPTSTPARAGAGTSLQARWQTEGDAPSPSRFAEPLQCPPVLSDRLPLRARISRKSLGPRSDSISAPRPTATDAPTPNSGAPAAANRAFLSLRLEAGEDAEFVPQGDWHMGPATHALSPEQNQVCIQLWQAFEAGQAWFQGHRRLADGSSLMLFASSPRAEQAGDAQQPSEAGPQAGHRVVLHARNGVCKGFKVSPASGAPFSVVLEPAPSRQQQPAVAESGGDRTAARPDFLVDLPAELRDLVLLFALQGEGPPDDALKGLALADKRHHALVAPFLAADTRRDAARVMSANSFVAVHDKILNLHVAVSKQPTTDLLRRWVRMPAADQLQVVPTVESLLSRVTETTKVPLPGRGLRKDPLQAAASALDRLSTPAANAGFEVVAPFVLRRQDKSSNENESVREGLLCTSIRKLTRSRRPEKFQAMLDEVVPHHGQLNNGVLPRLANILPALPPDQQVRMAKQLFIKARSVRADPQQVMRMLYRVPLRRLHSSSRPEIRRLMGALAEKLPLQERRRLAEARPDVFAAP